MLEAGTYKARATAGWLGESAQKGTPYVGVMFSVIDGPHNGEQISWNGWLTEGAMKHTVKSLRVCGWQGDDLSALDTIKRNEVFLVVEIEADGYGQPRPRVRWINSTQGGPAMEAALKGSAAKAMAEKHRAAVIALRQAEGNGGAAEFSDDDLPY